MATKEELLKQFAVNVKSGTNPKTNEIEFHCPTCGSTVDYNAKQCVICKQVLSWKKVQEENEEKCGFKLEGTLKFDLQADFTKGDCRKCPLSYIAKDPSGNVYICPITQNNSGCPLEVKQVPLQ